MANIRLPDIYGNALLYSENAYQRVGTTTSLPNANNVQFSSIGGITFNNTDSQGRTVYTAGERALAYYEYGTQGSSYGIGNTSLINYYTVQSGAPTVDDDNTVPYASGTLWYDTSTGDLYRCTDSTAGAAVWVQRTTSVSASTYGGVIRIWGSPAGNYYLNGIFLGSAWPGNEADAVAYNMQAGDKLGIIRGSGTLTRQLRMSFLPFDHQET